MAKGAGLYFRGDWNGTGIKKAQQDLSTFQRQAQGFSGAISKSMLGVGAAFGGAFAIGSLVGNAVDFLQDAAKAAVEDQKSVVALSKALDNLGLAHSQPAIEDFIGQLQLATGVADDQLRPAYQKLVTATGDVAKAQDLLNLSMDISAATGRDLSAVSQAMARASLGSMTALQRLGVPLDANIVKSKDFAAAQDVLTQKFGGQAAAAAETYEGKMRRLSTAVDEAKETIGYALVEALDGAATSMGGADGFIPMITDAGEEVADLVRGVGLLVQQMAQLTAQVSGDESASWWDSFTTILGTAVDMVPGMAPVVDTWQNVVNALNMAGDAAEAGAGMIDALRESASGWDVDLAKQAAGLKSQGDAAAGAARDYEMLNDEIKDYLGLISSSQALDDFRTDIANLGKTLDGNRTSFIGHGDAVKENRDTIRGAMGDVARIVQDMVDTGKISADEYDATFAKMRKSVIDGFVEQGFKRRHVRAFLEGEGIWGPTIKQVGASVEGTAVATGTEIGKDIARGIPLGFAKIQSSVNAAAAAVVRGAEAAARREAESDSPSLLFARVGEDLSLGVAKGVKDKTPAVVKAAADLIGQAAKAAGDSARESVSSGLGAVQSISDSVLSTVLGGVRLSTSGADGAALTPEQMVTALFGDIAAQRQAVSMLAASVGDTLPPELLQQFLSAGPQVAQGLAGLFAKNPELANQLALAYDELGTFTQEALGIPMGLAWGKVGEDSAREMLLNARGTLAARAEGFARWVYNNLAVTIPVDVALRNVPGRANGGPVAAGAPFVVGERGPELFVPSVSGTIVPNERVADAGGKVVNITVNAPVGADLRRAGQEIAEALRAFENGSGPIYVKAS